MEPQPLDPAGRSSEKRAKPKREVHSLSVKENIREPIRRAAVRRRLGMAYYSAAGRLLWLKMRNILFTEQSAAVLPFCCFEHKMPLLRKLKHADMWMPCIKTINQWLIGFHHRFLFFINTPYYTESNPLERNETHAPTALLLKAQGSEKGQRLLAGTARLAIRRFRAGGQQVGMCAVLSRY